MKMENTIIIILIIVIIFATGFVALMNMGNFSISHPDNGTNTTNTKKIKTTPTIA